MVLKFACIHPPLPALISTLTSSHFVPHLSLYVLFPTSQAPSHFHPPPPTHLPPTSSHLLPPSPSCLTSSGMLEFVEGCETLREIQTTQGVTGSFKDHVLADWLTRHNPTKTAYKQVNSVVFDSVHVSRSPSPCDPLSELFLYPPTVFEINIHVNRSYFL